MRLCTEFVVASNHSYEIPRLEGLALRECVASPLAVGERWAMIAVVSTSVAGSWIDGAPVVRARG
jgi:hypothetical protein